MIIYVSTGENKVTIKKRLMAEKQNPLLELEIWAMETHYVRRQVGFCAQWCLDNLCKYDCKYLCKYIIKCQLSTPFICFAC